MQMAPPSGRTRSPFRLSRRESSEMRDDAIHQLERALEGPTRDLEPEEPRDARELSPWGGDEDVNDRPDGAPQVRLLRLVIGPGASPTSDL